MEYKDILKRIAEKEKSSPLEVEKEMEEALKIAGINCSVKSFIESTSFCLKKTIYSR